MPRYFSNRFHRELLMSMVCFWRATTSHALHSHTITNADGIIGFIHQHGREVTTSLERSWHFFSGKSVLIEWTRH